MLVSDLGVLFAAKRSDWGYPWALVRPTMK
jgi:hypothetical protein